MTKALAERFWAKVSKLGPEPGKVQIEMYPEIAGTRCWPWLTALDNYGYGMFSFEGQNIHAHRMAFFLEYGKWPMPYGLHKCDLSSCCNPAHTFAGTSTDNNQDTAKKGRKNQPQGSAHGMAKLTEKLVKKIRELYRTGMYTQSVLAKRFKVVPGSISLIVANKTWKGKS